ncbi:GIT1 [Fusarium mundagurra]|uniref:GIT1 n=1 Tax=Fusarium mundagurra TaxID=1567541 RepID=A0A8H5YYC0_9HYPO|nr:GIT1 [Fusarium mundagurra]
MVVILALDLSEVCHELGRQLDEPTRAAALSNATQEIRQDADLVVIHCNERANGTAAPEKNMRAGLFGSSGSEQALGDAVCPPHPPLRESYPVEPMTEPLKTPELHATDTTLSSPSIPNSSSAAPTQPAPLCVPQQHAQLEMGSPHSNRPTINSTCPTTEERQQAHQAPNVVKSSNETSNVVVGMPHLRPGPCDAGHPYISQTGALYNFEACKSVMVLPPIRSVLEQGVNSHLSHEPFNQAPPLTDQPSSFPAPSVRVTTNAPSPPLPPQLLRSQPLSTKLTTQSSAIQASSSQGSNTQHAPTLPPHGQSYDLFHTRVASSSTTPDQHRLTSSAGPTSDSHDGFWTIASAAGVYDKISTQIAAFAVVFGIFQALGELGPGNNIGLLAAKTCATGVRGRYYGIAAAVGKIGAFVGTYVFPYIQAAGGNKTESAQYPFWVSSSLCILSALIVFFCIPHVGQDTITVEDQKFREYLQANGYDTAQMGFDAVGIEGGEVNVTKTDEK